MAQPFGIPVQSSAGQDLYHFEDIRMQLVTLQDNMLALMLYLDSIDNGTLTLRSSGKSLIELIRPAALLGRSSFLTITRLHNIFDTPVVSGFIFAGKTMKKKQRNTKEQRKTKRRRL